MVESFIFWKKLIKDFIENISKTIVIQKTIIITIFADVKRFKIKSINFI